MKLLSEISFFDLTLSNDDKDLLNALNELIKCINSRDIERRVKWMSVRKHDHLDAEAAIRVWNQLSEEYQGYKKVIAFLTNDESDELRACQLQLMQRMHAGEMTREAYALKLTELGALRKTAEAKYCRFTCFTLTELAQISMMLEELSGALIEASAASKRMKDLLANSLSEVSMLQSELQAYVTLAYFHDAQESKSPILRGSTGQMFPEPVAMRGTRRLSDPGSSQAGELFLWKMKRRINAIADKTIFSEKLSCWHDVSPQSKSLSLRCVFRAERAAVTLQDYFMQASGTLEGSDVGEKTPDLLVPIEDDIFDELERMSPSEFLLPEYPVSKIKKKSVNVSTEAKLDDLSDEIEKNLKHITQEWDHQFERLVAASVVAKTDFAHSAPSVIGSYMANMLRMSK